MSIRWSGDQNEPIWLQVIQTSTKFSESCLDDIRERQQVKSLTSNFFVPQNVANIQKNPFVQIRKGSFFLSSQSKILQTKSTGYNGGYLVFLKNPIDPQVLCIELFYILIRICKITWQTYTTLTRLVCFNLLC